MTKNRRPRHREKFWQTRCNAFVCRCTLPTSVRTWTIGLSRLKLSEFTQISEFLFGLRHLVNLEPPNMTQMLQSKFKQAAMQCLLVHQPTSVCGAPPSPHPSSSEEEEEGDKEETDQVIHSLQGGGKGEG